TRELDRLVEPPAEQGDEADREQDARDDERLPAERKEVVVGVGEDADHWRQMLRVVAAGSRRSSQIMNMVRVTKIAVNIDAMTPRIRVTAKPRTGPVPNWKRKSAVSTIVTFESMIALIACLKPSFTARRTVLPAW